MLKWRDTDGKILITQYFEYFTERFVLLGFIRPKKINCLFPVTARKKIW